MPAARPQPLAAHRRGYTLVELILVIAVLGLAGALVAPRLGDRGDFDTQALVRKLVADATFAQMDALANQEFRRIEFLQDPDTGEFLGWCIVRLDETELGLPYDPSTARHVRDSLSGSGEQRFLVAEDGRFAGARVSSPSTSWAERSPRTCSRAPAARSRSRDARPDTWCGWLRSPARSPSCGSEVRKGLKWRPEAVDATRSRPARLSP
jgi:prepilin-type N-terminal cleavage/methylation domain-containing protein